MESLQLKEFVYEGETLKIRYVDTTHPNEYSDCDVYIIVGQNDRDLGIIRIKKGGFTPLQKVIKGNKTVEGYISGSGKLIVNQIDGSQNVYVVNSESNDFHIEIKIGETMQWFANNNSELVVFEICYPPYEDGRFDNI